MIVLIHCDGGDDVNGAVNVVVAADFAPSFLDCDLKDPKAALVYHQMVGHCCRIPTSSSICFMNPINPNRR